MSADRAETGSLVVVGIGIALGQTTLEAKAHLEQADKVFYLVSNPSAVRWVHQLNPTAESLYPLYTVGKDRSESYNQMVETILTAVRGGAAVCTAFYGHPGVFVDPGHRAVRIARSEGFPARMLAGVSAEDYLFADLGVDPARCGCQSFEATDFLIHARVFDPTAVLLLWQLGSLGDNSFRFKSERIEAGLAILLDRLLPEYGPEHVVTVYEGSVFPVCESKMVRVPLGELTAGHLTTISTLYIPPRRPAAPDLSVVRRLGLDRGDPAAPKPGAGE